MDRWFADDCSPVSVICVNNHHHNGSITNSSFINHLQKWFSSICMPQRLFSCKFATPHISINHTNIYFVINPLLAFLAGFLEMLFFSSLSPKNTMVAQHAHGKFVCRCIDHKLLLSATAYYQNPHFWKGVTDWLIFMPIICFFFKNYLCKDPNLLNGC